MIITINISKEEIDLLESGNAEAAAAAAELYRYTLLQAAMASKNVHGEGGPTNYFVVSPPYNVQDKANTALCVPHPKYFPTAPSFDMDKAHQEKEQGIVRPEIKTDIPNAFKNIIWKDEGKTDED